MQASLEAQARDAADAWRILGHLGFVDTIFNHISVVSPDHGGNLRIIMNRDGLLPQEVDPGCFSIIPLREYSSSDALDLGINPDGLRIHSLLHSLRMKPGAIIHTHSIYSVAVGCSRQGLLPLSQASMEFAGDLNIVDYEGVFRSHSLTEKLKITATDGGIALLRNHGTLVVADDIPEALYLTYYLEEACRIQVVTLSQGVPVVLPPEEAITEAKLELRNDRAAAAAQLFKAFCRQIGART